MTEEIDEDDSNRMNDRIKTLKDLINVMCKFNSEDEKKYIMNSISFEMWLAYSIGAYGKNNGK